MHPLAEALEKPSEAFIIGYLATSPLRSHTARELAKRLRVSNIKIHTALNNLVEKGWLKVTARHDQSFYLFNLKYPAASQLRQALLKNKPAPKDEFIIAIIRLGAIKAAFLSGIFTGHTELPTDLLIVGKINQVKLQEFLKNTQKMLGQDINYSTMTTEEFLQRRNMLDRFLRDLFDHPYLTVVDKL